MDDLTSIVTSTLEARGVLNKIRAELRANVFSAIQEQQGGADDAPNAALEGLRRTSHGQLAAEVRARRRAPRPSRRRRRCVHACPPQLATSSSPRFSSAAAPARDAPQLQPRLLARRAAARGRTDRSQESRPQGSVRGGPRAPTHPTRARARLPEPRVAPLSVAPASHASRSAASLGLDATGEEPLLAQLVRERMQGSRAKPLSARADSDAAAAAPPAQPTGGGSSLGARDLPPLGRPSAGGPLGDLPPLGGRPRGADDEQEEERRLDAIESKLGLLAGMPLTTARPATAPAQSATAPAATGADDFEDELIEEDISDEFEEDESDELSMSASQSAPLVAGGLGSLSASLQTSRVFDRSMDESMSPTRLNRELQGFDHTEEVEPLRAAAALPPLQPRSSGPSLAPLQTPRGASSQPQLSVSQTL